MVDGPYDFAVIGSTPLCALLAGLLATVHNKRVVLVAESPSPFRLLRGYDLAAAPLTRPETWALLSRSAPVVLKLVGELGRGLFRRIDPLVVAHDPAAIEALAHMRHVAAGFGNAIEREAPRTGAAYRLRDVPLLDRVRVAGPLSAWLVRSGVPQLAAQATQLSLQRDGSIRIENRNTALEATHAILGDDAAILAHLGRGGSSILRAVETTSLLTEPTGPLAAPLVIHADLGLSLLQRPGGAIAALGPNSAGIGAVLAAQGPLRKAGEVTYRTFATADGAPVVGLARTPKATLIAGLDPIGAFLAPALARIIAGAASDDEMRYFAARDFGKGRATAADFSPALPAGEAA